MRNRFYRWGRGPATPEEIDPEAYLRAPDSVHGHYFVEVLAEVNRILAEHDVNIEGQVLSTRGNLGYVVTDVGSGFAPEVLDALNAMKSTVRLRVIT